MQLQLCIPLAGAECDHFNSAACGQGTVWDEETETCIVANPSDTDFDGCVSMVDLLDLLTVFGTCNETSWECGDPLEYQGYDYETVQIGEQCWFAENARFLPEVSPPDVGGEDDAAAHAYVSGYSGSSESEASNSQGYLDFAPFLQLTGHLSFGICVPLIGTYQLTKIGMLSKIILECQRMNWTKLDGEVQMRGQC